MSKRKHKSVEIITDPKRLKNISVTTTIDFVDSEDTEDIQNVCRINLEDLDFEDSDSDDLTESETDSESETESEESSP